MRRILSKGDSPPLVIVLIYIEAYGISIFSPDPRFDADIFGMTTPNTRIITGIAAKNGTYIIPSMGRSIGIIRRYVNVKMDMGMINEIKDATLTRLK